MLLIVIVGLLCTNVAFFSDSEEEEGEKRDSVKAAFIGFGKALQTIKTPTPVAGPNNGPNSPKNGGPPNSGPNSGPNKGASSLTHSRSVTFGLDTVVCY